MSKRQPISKLYHLSFDQLPALEEQLMKLKTRSTEMQRAIIASMASAIGLCDVALLSDRLGLTNIGSRCNGGGEGGINKPLSYLFEDPSYLNSPKKNSIQETYADFGFRVVEMLEYWNEIQLEDEEWVESYKSYVLKNKESRSDLVQRLSEL
mgnify:CR=1 FL=1